MALKEQKKVNPLGPREFNYLPTTNARKLIKGSKDADFSLVSFFEKTSNYPWLREPWPNKPKPILPHNMLPPKPVFFNLFCITDHFMQ